MIAVVPNSSYMFNKKKVSYEFENKSFSFPKSYNSAKWNRATIAMLGYHAFTKESEKYFTGKVVGSVVMIFNVYVPN